MFSYENWWGAGCKAPAHLALVVVPYEEHMGPTETCNSLVCPDALKRGTIQEGYLYMPCKEAGLSYALVKRLITNPHVRA